MTSIFRGIKGYLIKQIFIIVDLDCINKIILFSASWCARIKIWVSTYAHFSPESCCQPSFGSNLSAGTARAPTHFNIHWTPGWWITRRKLSTLWTVMIWKVTPTWRGSTATRTLTRTVWTAKPTMAAWSWWKLRESEDVVQCLSAVTSQASTWRGFSRPWRRLIGRDLSEEEDVSEN